MLIAVKIFRNGVVGDQQIKPTAVVHVNKDRRQAVVTPGVGNAGLHTNVGKGPIAVVVKQMIALARQSARAAHHRDSAKLTKPRRKGALASDRRIVGIEFRIAGNKEIEKAIVIVIAPGCARRPAPQRDSSLFSDVGERTVMIVVVEAVLSEIGNIDIGPAIIVIIADHNAKTPAL